MSDHDCTCGGCGTNTPCCHDTNSTQSGLLDGIYAYAAPPVSDHKDPLKPWRDYVSTDSAAAMETMMRSTLDQEMLKDLLQRVQQLEETIADLKAEVQTWQEKATAPAEDFDPEDHSFDQIFTSLDEFLQWWLARGKK